MFESGISISRKSDEIDYLINTYLQGWETQPQEKRVEWINAKLARLEKKSHKIVSTNKPIATPVVSTVPAILPEKSQNFAFNLDRTAYTKEKAARAKAREEVEKLNNDLDQELEERVKLSLVERDYQIFLDVFSDWVKGGGSNEIRKLISELETAKMMSLDKIYPLLLEQYNFVQKVLADLEAKKQSSQTKGLLSNLAKIVRSFKET